MKAITDFSNDFLNNKDKNIQKFAFEISQYHNYLGYKNRGKSLLPSIKSMSTFVKEAYSQINTYYHNTGDVIPAAEWYLDNYYIINDLINDLLTDLQKQYENKLLYFVGGEDADNPRIYIVISQFMNFLNNEINQEKLQSFIVDYQTQAPLSSAEIWSIPIMIKIIILEKITDLVERILYIQKERDYADKWIEAILGEDNEFNLTFNTNTLNEKKDYSSVFIERVATKLKDYGPETKLLLNWLDNIASRQHNTTEKIINTEQYYLSLNGVQTGNFISAIKQVNSQNWSNFFESVSLIQKVLETDSAQIYRKMDFESRDKYRHQIEKLAKRFKVSELIVARTVLKLANSYTE
ncbi:MAG: glycosyl transferase family 36, partial [Eubacteriales bacterium]